MFSLILQALILIKLLYLVQNFVQIVPQFNSSILGPDVIIHDAVMINSSRNLIIAYNLYTI
jgi:hypothetical protein